MRSGLKLGRLWGIRIGIDWSWLIIFLLITWNLSIVFQAQHENWSKGVVWGTAIAASLLFFASILAHELAHSLLAKMFKIPVEDITLFLFGGVSNIQKQPTAPRHEFQMSIVGPITSIVLGILFLFAASIMIGPIETGTEDMKQFFSELSPLATLLLWLGPVNIFVGLFNLLPGFPLDGGRILRSILWGIMGDLKKATKWASITGQAIAWGFILMGISMVFGAVVPFFGGGPIGGLWLVFIGWFLNSAAVQSYRQQIIRDVLSGVKVSEIMTSDPPQVTPDMSIDDLVHDRIMKSDDHAFPVQANGHLEGMVTLDDVRKTTRDEWTEKQVKDIMTPVSELVCVASQQDAEDAFTRMMQKDVRQLPVVDNEQLRGLLRRRDVMKWIRLQTSEAE